MKRAGRVNPRSEKRKALMAGDDGRAAFVARVLLETPICEAQTVIVWKGHLCDALAVDVHEKAARSHSGTKGKRAALTTRANVLALCRLCHDWVGQHPKEALALGLRLSRYEGRNPPTTLNPGGPDDEVQDPVPHDVLPW